MDNLQSSVVFITYSKTMYKNIKRPRFYDLSNVNLRFFESRRCMYVCARSCIRACVLTQLNKQDFFFMMISLIYLSLFSGPDLVVKMLDTCLESSGTEPYIDHRISVHKQDYLATTWLSGYYLVYPRTGQGS